jgi:hypothetical protein
MLKVNRAKTLKVQKKKKKKISRKTNRDSQKVMQTRISLKN